MKSFVKQSCEKVHNMARAIRPGGQPVRVMEVCGTHTMAIARCGLRELLPGNLKLISGPGCPVCVTDQSYMDSAVALALGRAPAGRDASPPIIATYGDMVRVPGRYGSLAEARSAGASVEVVVSADQAVDLALESPRREVVFLAVGFETTAPATALAIRRARREKVANFTALVAHKQILPAMRALLRAGDSAVDGFLCPGHVSVIIGWRAYEALSTDFRRPCVVAGFDAAQIVTGLIEILGQLRSGEPRACSVYPSVSEQGNPEAIRVLESVFETTDAAWRAMGVIPGSGLALREDYADFDAARRFDLPELPSESPAGCRCGEVIRGLCEPRECGLFGGTCTPRDPVGPCMVSSEGACAAAYKYGRPGRPDGANLDAATPAGRTPLAPKASG